MSDSTSTSTPASTPTSTSASTPTSTSTSASASNDPTSASSALDPVARELRDALNRHPRTLPPRWLYDDRGSELFSEITGLDEYYQTEAERSILAGTSTLLAEITGATTVIELGSGTSDKTRTLLDSFVTHGVIERFVPLDVSEQTLLAAAKMLRDDHPDLAVEPVVGDFTRHLDRLADVGRDPVHNEVDDDHRAAGPRLVLFLGGTIGNFYVEERRAFLGALADTLAPGDWLLLGIDRVKPIDRLIHAYDDSAGVTEAFIRNALTNINTTYDGDLDVGSFGYVPLWDGRQERIDMRLRAEEPMTARVDGLDLDLELAAGEEIRVEISSKFRPDEMVDELAHAGFDGDSHVFTDDNDDFALILAQRT